VCTRKIYLIQFSSTWVEALLLPRQGVKVEGKVRVWGKGEGSNSFGIAQTYSTLLVFFVGPFIAAAGDLSSSGLVARSSLAVQLAIPASDARVFKCRYIVSQITKSEDNPQAGQ
jgi:hypothetical protein